MNRLDFGNELVKIRKAKGLTQSELAELCKVSYRTIQRIESGKVTPRSFTIKTLSTALEFDFLKEFPINLSEKGKHGAQRFILSKQIVPQTIDLFNLKTNAMRKLSVLTVMVGLIGFGAFFISNRCVAQDNSALTNFLTMESNEAISQKEAIKMIGEINKKAKFHNQSIDLVRTYAKESDYNYDTYVLIAKLIASFGHSTQPVMEIADIVFSTHHDCDLFNEITPLIFINTDTPSHTFVEMAKKASEIKTDDEKNNLRNEIDKYKALGEYKTLDEAFNNQ